MTAGIQSELDNAFANVDTNVVTEWVNSLTEEEAKLANSKEFEQALEIQINELNGATLSANDYATALQNIRDAQTNLNANKNPISLPYVSPLTYKF